VSGHEATVIMVNLNRYHVNRQPRNDGNRQTRYQIGYGVETGMIYNEEATAVTVVRTGERVLPSSRTNTLKG
jgi:hypothetical protein